MQGHKPLFKKLGNGTKPLFLSFSSELARQGTVRLLIALGKYKALSRVFSRTFKARPQNPPTEKLFDQNK